MIECDILVADKRAGVATLRIERNGRVIHDRLNFKIELLPDGSVDEGALGRAVSRYVNGRDSKDMLAEFREELRDLPTDEAPEGRAVHVARDPSTVLVAGALDSGDVLDHVWESPVPYTVSLVWGEAFVDGKRLVPPFVSETPSILERPAGKGPRIDGLRNQTAFAIAFDSDELRRAGRRSPFAAIRGFSGFAGQWRQTLPRDFAQNEVRAVDLQASGASAVDGNRDFIASVRRRP